MPSSTSSSSVDAKTAMSLPLLSSRAKAEDGSEALLSHDMAVF
jgi:hypothetical protein